MRRSWVNPQDYGISDFSEEALVGGQSTILIPEHLHLRGECRVDSQTYISVGLVMENKTVICPGAKVIGGADRLVTLKLGSFIGWNCLVMARSEDYRYLVGVGFGAPGPSIEGDVTFERFSGLGSMSSCFPGVTLPEGALIASHSMVHSDKNLKPWWIHKGTPALPWKPRDKDRVLREAEEAGWMPA